MSNKTTTNNSDGHEFSLELVATVAATLLAGKLNDEKEPKSYLWIADEAVQLLKACKTRLQNGESFEGFRSRMAVEEEVVIS